MNSLEVKRNIIKLNREKINVLSAQIAELERRALLAKEKRHDKDKQLSPSNHLRGLRVPGGYFLFGRTMDLLIVRAKPIIIPFRKC